MQRLNITRQLLIPMQHCARKCQNVIFFFSNDLNEFIDNEAQAENVVPARPIITHLAKSGVPPP
jgi:hypothetical protein